MTLPPMVNTPAPVKRKKKATAINASGIREMFVASKKKKTPKIIAIRLSRIKFREISS